MGPPFFGWRGMIRVGRERYETPESVAGRLKGAGGVNRYGEANYRVVWGWNRLNVDRRKV